MHRWRCVTDGERNAEWDWNRETVILDIRPSCYTTSIVRPHYPSKNGPGRVDIVSRVSQLPIIPMDDRQSLGSDKRLFEILPGIVSGQGHAMIATSATR